jgi:hypothetical protein
MVIVAEGPTKGRGMSSKKDLTELKYIVQKIFSKNWSNVFPEVSGVNKGYVNDTMSQA